jgi:hypothetical protein
MEQGDAPAAGELLPLVYDELRRLAAQKLAQEKPGQTIEATGLVHEAYLPRERCQSATGHRGHFFAAAAEAMRRILLTMLAARPLQARWRYGSSRRRRTATTALGSARICWLDDAVRVCRT